MWHCCIPLATISQKGANYFTNIKVIPVFLSQIFNDKHINKAITHTRMHTRKQSTTALWTSKKPLTP